MVPFHLQVLNKFYLLLNCSEKLDGNQSCHPDQHFSSILLPLIFSSPLYLDRKDPLQSSSRFSHDKSKLKHWITKLSVSVSLHQNNNIAIICFQNQWKWDSQSVIQSCPFLHLILFSFFLFFLSCPYCEVTPAFLDCKQSLFSSRIHVEECKTIKRASIAVGMMCGSAGAGRQAKRENAMFSYSSLDDWHSDDRVLTCIFLVYGTHCKWYAAHGKLCC